MNTKAKAMLVEGRCLRPPAKPPHRAEAQRDIPGPKTILVSQQLPRRTKQRPFGGTRKKICGAHLKSQGPLRPLQQGVQLPFAIQPAVKLTPQSQKSCPGMRRAEQLTVSARETLQCGYRSRIQMPNTPNRNIATQQLIAAVNNK